MNKAYKYRIYPTEEQMTLLFQTFGCCRKIWNLMLADSQEHEKHYVPTPAHYKDEYPYLRDVDSQALANVQMQLKQAYSNHFKNPKHFGMPVFKARKYAKKSFSSCVTNENIGILDDQYIKLPKLGKILAVIHRKIPDGYILKSATVSMERDGSFYCSLLYEYDARNFKEYTIDYGNAIGLDYKSDGFYVDSDGNTCGSPKFHRHALKKLAREQRRLARMIGNEKDAEKSRNYMKQLVKVNKLYRHVSNQRKDFAHKKSTEIANQYDIVCVEDLNLTAISNKGFGNGKATLDNGFGMFRAMLEYKLRDRHKKFVKVDQWFPSSQLCHCCGYRNPEMKDLHIRKWACPQCNAELDRDDNAATNIKVEGIRILLSY